MNLSSARWRKSTHSGPETDCVEVAFVPGEVGVRDSKNPTGGALVLPERAWRGFYPECGSLRCDAERATQ